MYQKEMFELLATMMRFASEPVVEDLRKAVAKLARDAKETPNPWDDILAVILGIILGQPGEPRDSGGE